MIQIPKSGICSSFYSTLINNRGGKNEHIFYNKLVFSIKEEMVLTTYNGKVLYVYQNLY